MKIILVDAVHTFVVKIENGYEIYQPMQKMLDEFPNTKVILTNANDDELIKFELDKMPYEVFTCKHNPDKTNSEYFKKMLEHLKLKSDDVVYFEHSLDAIKSAQSVGIKTYYWDCEKKPLRELCIFLEQTI